MVWISQKFPKCLAENLANHLLDEMIEALSSLPGIGRKSAFRISFHLLRLEQGLFNQFIHQLTDTKTKSNFANVAALMQKLKFARSVFPKKETLILFA